MSTSDASVSSTRSLQSQGPVNEKDMLSRSERTCKAPAHWTHEEEARFLQYLLTHKAQAGDTMSFKNTTFQAAADDINQSFPAQHGGAKTASVCKTKWTNLKDSYNAVINIKKTSGFSWSDELGAGITDAHGDIWEKYVKNSPAAKLFKTKGFSHFNTIDQIMPQGPSTARGKFVKHQPQASSAMPSVAPSESSSSILMPPPLYPPGHTPTMSNSMNLTQLVSATDEINLHQASPLAQVSMMPPSSGSHSRPPVSGRTVSLTFSSTTSDSGLTSVSCAKYKFSALPNEGEWQSPEAVPSSLSIYILPHIINNLTAPSEPSVQTAMQEQPPSTDLGRAINLLTQTEGLSMDDVMELTDYLSSNPTEAVVFANFKGGEYRTMWAQRKLSIICCGATSTTL
ncbi:uncharacterized protein EDB93DRAFT_1261280 [Suillus bovinus]|uniref:uncharacterized protein n=1 Tax=Suillus bovinus TaxID=48563 RepID=UPI001B85BED1|nr:uncharacterized protein EDB93DRAFT_1261280 [Suillus bovinus]KAG2160043.1 hypothetical protein EDB93DRAFT_1261280 [Suillus bovinus]